MLTVKPSALHHLCSAVPVARWIVGGSLVAFAALSSACGDDEVSAPPLLGAAGPVQVIQSLQPDAGAEEEQPAEEEAAEEASDAPDAD